MNETLASSMSPAFLVTTLSVAVALLATIVLFITINEYTRLRRLRREFQDFEENWKQEMQKTQKAMQRVVASYQINDPDQRIKILESAVAIDPGVYNGYNALGYAHLDKGDTAGAVDAFKEAIHQHPEQIEGYCDLARAYLKQGQESLARKYLARAEHIDASAVRQGLQGDDFLEHLLDK